MDKPDYSDWKRWCFIRKGNTDLWKHNKVEFSFEANVSSSYLQIFGHSQVSDIVIDNNLVCVDCLGSVVKSYQI